MHIVVCGSLVFAKEMDELRTQLQALGHTVTIPTTADLILDGEITLEDMKRMKEEGTHHEMSIGRDAIRAYHAKIVEGDAVLIANYEKKGLPGYIGGNTFLEMGFAHVLNKPLYVLNPLPDLSYVDEMHAMQPTILNGDIKKLA